MKTFTPYATISSQREPNISFSNLNFKFARIFHQQVFRMEGIDDKEDVLTSDIVIGAIRQGSLEQIFSAK